MGRGAGRPPGCRVSGRQEEEVPELRGAAWGLTLPTASWALKRACEEDRPPGMRSCQHRAPQRQPRPLWEAVGMLCAQAGAPPWWG